MSEIFSKAVDFVIGTAVKVDPFISKMVVGAIEDIQSTSKEIKRGAELRSESIEIQSQIDILKQEIQHLKNLKESRRIQNEKMLNKRKWFFNFW